MVPALNEQDNVDALVQQVREHVCDAGIDAELIVVDDGSDDLTWQRLSELQAQFPWLRPIRHAARSGQSAAMGTGIQHARGAYIATLDADLQNDPADLPKMLAKLQQENADFAQGHRANRKDTIVKKCTSRVGRGARKLILADTIKDTGCSTRVVRSEIAKQFPLQFKGMHRFMPVYAGMMGATIVELPVNHRPRVSGTSKYGILNRGFVGFFDCLAMRWMLKRYRAPQVEAQG